MKKRIAILFVILVVIMLLPFAICTAIAEETSGELGNGLWWTFADGKLTIGGRGAMPSYMDDEYEDEVRQRPWESLMSQINEVDILYGITSIGNFVFGSISYDDDPSNPCALQVVTIPDSVNDIGKHAFSYCKNLTTITIPDSVTSIGNSAFSRCTGLTEITIPDSVTSIGTHIFYGCTGLKSVIIGNGVTSIGNCAFFDCAGLTEIIIPDGVTSISDSAFSNCTGLTEITIPDGVTSIGSDAFSGCEELETISIGEGVTSIGSYAFSDTAWWNAQSDGLVYLDYILLGVKGTPDQIIRIKDGTKLIANLAFSECYYITKVTIPDSVTSIGELAFYDCMGLSEITIPDSVISIGAWAFSNCTGLTLITIPDNVTSIKEYTFYECTGIESITIGSDVTSIGVGAFNNCTGLSDVYYNGTRQMRDSISIGSDNENLTNATWHYLSPVSIEMKTLPDKLSYQEGKDTLDVTGGKIATYYDYDIIEEEDLTAEMVTGFDNTKVGTQTLTVTFDGQTTTFEVTVSHVPGDSVHENEVPPTCTEEGHYDEVVYCTICHAKVSCEEHSIPSYGHTPGNPVRENEVAATTAAEGHYDEVVYCTVCHAELSRERHSIPKLPVTVFDGTVTIDPNDVKLNGKTPYRVYNGKAQAPDVIVKDKNGKTLAASQYTVSYRNNKNPGTAYVDVTITSTGATASVWFKIYLPATTTTSVQNVENGIQVSWKKVAGAKGYVIYRRAWNLKDAGWTKFERWNNTNKTTWTDTKVYAGTRYQYGVKAYFADPMDNYNLGLVGPLKTTVRITTRMLNSVTPGSKKLTVRWTGSSLFTGYQVQVATDANFTKDVQTVTVSKAKTYQTAVSKLKPKTVYYVRVRSYHVFDGTTYYGGWSNVLNGKAK